MTTRGQAARLCAMAVAVALLAPAPKASWAQAPRQGTQAPQGGQTGSIEENRKEVLQLADAFGIQRTLDLILFDIRMEAIRVTIKASEHSEDEAARIVDDIIMPNFKARAGELATELVEIYATNFTISDLRALRVFFSSPMGQKYLRVQGLAHTQAMQAGLAWGRRVFQDSVDRHADELRARGLKF